MDTERKFKFSRRSLVAVSGAAALPRLLNPLTTYADKLAAPLENHDAFVKNTKITEATPNIWFHPISKNGAIWSYGVELKNPGLTGATLDDEGVVGEVLLKGSSDVGLDIRTNFSNPRWLGDYLGQGVRPALWLATSPGDYVYLMEQDNQPIRVVAANERGFAGVIMQNTNSQFGIRVERKSQMTDPVKVRFTNISQDYLNQPLDLSVIDTADPHRTGVKFEAVTPPFVAVVEPAPTPSPTPPTAPIELPARVDELPARTFQEGYTTPNTFFLARNNKGEGWSKSVAFALPERTLGVFYGSTESVGELRVATRNRASNFDVYFKINPVFIEDYRQGSQNRPAVWIETQPNSLIQLLNSDRSVVAAVRSDGAGFGGMVLPDYVSELGVRIVLPHPEVDKDTYFRFGPEKPSDRGKQSTLDSTRFIPRP